MKIVSQYCLNLLFPYFEVEHLTFKSYCISFPGGSQLFFCPVSIGLLVFCMTIFGGLYVLCLSCVLMPFHSPAETLGSYVFFTE